MIAQRPEVAALVGDVELGEKLGQDQQAVEPDIRPRRCQPEAPVGQLRVFELQHRRQIIVRIESRQIKIQPSFEVGAQFDGRAPGCGVLEER